MGYGAKILNSDSNLHLITVCLWTCYQTSSFLDSRASDYQVGVGAQNLIHQKLPNIALVFIEKY